MEIKRTDDKKMTIREKSGMKLHQRKKKIVTGKKEKNPVFNRMKIHIGKQDRRKKIPVGTGEKQTARNQGGTNIPEKGRRTEVRAERSVPFVSGKEKSKQNLKGELFLGAMRNHARRETEEGRSLEGERELIQSGTLLSEGYHAMKPVAEITAEKVKRLKIHRTEGKIKRSEGKHSSHMRKRTSVTSNSSVSASGKKWTAKEKFRKLGFAAMASGLVKKFQRGKPHQDEEGGMKKIVQTFFLTGAVGTVIHIVLTALPILLIIIFLYNSPFALFLPKVEEGENIQQVLAGYYQEFNLKVNEQKTQSGVSVTYANDGKGIGNFRDVLMVYMVKYYTGTGEIGTVVDDKAKENLKTIFDEMNYYKQETTPHTVKAGESLGEVVTSAYCSCPVCCGQWSGGPTASGVMPTPNHTIAVDAQNPFVPMGTKVLFNGMVYTVEDTGNFDQYGVQFDVYFSDHTTAQNWGHKTFECYLAEGESNEVEVTSTSINVYHLTYQEYIETGKLTEEQAEFLTEIMESDVWENFSDSTAGGMVAVEALTKVGCGYDQNRRYEEGYYDCSSLVQRLYRDVAGIELPATAAPQGQYCYENGMTVKEEELLPGDLIFYSYETNGEFMDISHVAIYVGDGMMVHASSPTRGVVYDPFSPSNIGLYGRPY